MEGSHVIDVNNLVNSMTSELKYGCRGVMNEKKAAFPVIKKIKRRPSNADKDVDETIAVYVGPYHHKSNATPEIERRKWDSLRYILQLNPENTMRDYLGAMAGLEQQIRVCYADEFSIGTDEFMKRMLLDGCFLLYILHGIEEPPEMIPQFKMANADDGMIRSEQNIHEAGITIEANASQQITSNNSEHIDILDNAYYMEQWNDSFQVHDLVLLENQIPFFVVVKIFDLATNGNIPITELLRNLSMFIEDVLQPYPRALLNFDQMREIHHLLHLCHLYFKPNPIHVTTSSNLSTSYDDEVRSMIVGQQLPGWHRASEYYKVGVEFRKRETCIENPHSLLDISFRNGVMEIPCLTIDPNTYSLFCNLIAFEETRPQFENYMTTYVVFLSQFITMPEDASLLAKRGIVVDQLDGGTEVSDLFRMLAQGLSFDFNGEYYLKHICRAMEMHYQLRRSRWSKWLGAISSNLPGWQQN